MAGLIRELKRRNVFKVGAAYVVMAWLLAQGVDVFLENFGAPAWVIKTVLLLLVAGPAFVQAFTARFGSLHRIIDRVFARDCRQSGGAFAEASG